MKYLSKNRLMFAGAAVLVVVAFYSGNGHRAGILAGLGLCALANWYDKLFPARA